MIPDNSYVSIQGFMKNKLGLKGNELLVYALIYGFSQDGESEFTGTISYIMDWFDMSKSTVMRSLKSLVDKGLVTKTEYKIYEKAKRCGYKVILEAIYEAYVPPEERYQNDTGGGVKMTPGRCQNDTGGGVKMTPGRCQNDTGGGVKMTPNNIYINNNNNINNNIKSIRATLVIPTIEQVAEYCHERGDKVDPVQWYDHYSSNGWMVGKNKMKDWKAAVRTWERNGIQNGKKKQSGNDGSVKRDYDFDSLEQQLLDY